MISSQSCHANNVSDIRWSSYQFELMHVFSLEIYVRNNFTNIVNNHNSETFLLNYSLAYLMIVSHTIITNKQTKVIKKLV